LKMSERWWLGVPLGLGKENRLPVRRPISYLFPG
jgi:hypothetical protein